MSEKTDKEKAYSELLEAKRKMNTALQTLGFDDAHDAMDKLNDTNVAPGMPRRERDAISAATNAYSYLDNGSIENLVKDDE